MTSPSVDRRCPYCGEWTPAALPRCQRCGESEGDHHVPAGEAPLEAADFLVPRRTNLWSMIACYIGLLGCILPVVGFFLGIVATVAGVIALWRRRQETTYHSITNDLRAVFGLIFGLGGILIWGTVLFSWLTPR